MGLWVYGLWMVMGLFDRIMENEENERKMNDLFIVDFYLFEDGHFPCHRLLNELSGHQIDGFSHDISCGFTWLSSCYGQQEWNYSSYNYI